MKKRAYPILLALFLALQLAGCGGGGDGGSSAGSASGSNEAVSYESSASGIDGINSGAGGIDGSVYDDSKLILRGSIHAEATDFDRALAAIEQQVAEAGGYIESSSVRGSSGARWAELTIRTPREQFDSTFNAVGENCHVTESARSSENVSEVYYDSEARKAALEVKRDRLMALLEKAEKMEDIITLEDALSEVQYQIEKLSGTLRGYDRLIAFSTLDVYLAEVRDLSVVQKSSFLDDLQGAAVMGTRGLVSFLQGVILTVVYAWWFFLLLALLLAVAMWRMRKRRSAREALELRMQRKTPEPPEPPGKQEPPSK